MKITTLLANYGNPDHAKAIVSLMDMYSRDEMGGGSPLPETTKSGLAEALAKLPQAFTVLCYVDGEPAGLINCLEGFSTFKCMPLINVHDVAVDPAYRGLGISQIMLKQVEDVALERGCCKITLEVLEGNTAAKKAYEKFGFEGYELDPAMGKALFWQKLMDK